MRVIENINGRWQLANYLRYLNESAPLFPPGAREYALADWHYEMGHPQCPHDSWIEDIAVKIASSGQRSELRSVGISSKYFGACHDGYHVIDYEDVHSYSFDIAGWGRDWLLDEVFLDKPGVVRHEITFENGTLIVYCADLHYRWLPK
jgi:hypothetical protein